MILKTLKVCVRSGGSKLGLFLVENIYNQKDVYVLTKKSCEWFDAIGIGNFLEVLVSSDGSVHSVIDLIADNLAIQVKDETFKIRRGQG
jgi:hypothetical protein